MLTIEDIERLGLEKTAEIALELAWDGTDAVYISFDVDSVDCGFVPGTGWPEPGGFLPREALKLVGLVAKEGICGLEVVEVSPPYDTSDITALFGTRVVVEVLGAMVATASSAAQGDHRQAGRLLMHDDHARHHGHDHNHGPGHNQPPRQRRAVAGAASAAGRGAPPPDQPEPDFDLVEAAFAEGFGTASDPTSFLRLAGVPFEGVDVDGRPLVPAAGRARAGGRYRRGDTASGRRQLPLRPSARQAGGQAAPVAAGLP